MTNDAHDTNITFAAKWLRGWLTPLLNDSYFMDETLIVITFDENDDYPIPNNVWTLLLGGAVDKSLHGTTDSMFYNHYSCLSTVEVNWDLPSLGRWDCDANVFGFVAEKAGYQNTNISISGGTAFNSSYPGPVNEAQYTPGWWPAPNTEARCAAGRGVLQSIKDTWGNTTGSFNYTNVYPYDELSGTNAGGTPTIGIMDRSNSSTASSSSASASHSKNAAPAIVPETMAAVGIAGLFAAFL